MQPFVLSVRVYLEDTDAQGVVYNASYFRFMERARTDWLRERGIDHTVLAERLGIALVLTSIAAKFHAPAALGDLLEVSAEVIHVRGARVVFEQTVRRSGEVQTLLSGTAEVACKSIAGGRPVRWPPELFKELNQ
jgi:tol-pal system-associated acyl-CoA thioesterase